MLTQKQPPGTTILSTSATEQVSIANQILTNARQLREKLAAESTEASQRLSQTLLDVVVYAEQVENTGRLLALADSCIGQIRSRMRVHGIPIHVPSAPSDITVPDVNGPAVQGMFFTRRTNDYIFTIYQMGLPNQRELLHM